MTFPVSVPLDIIEMDFAQFWLLFECICPVKSYNIGPIPSNFKEEFWIFTTALSRVTSLWEWAQGFT